MVRRKTAVLVCVLCLLMGWPLASQALVNFEAGQMEVNGILLLQDANDPNSYYYLPPAPRVSTRADGGLELSVVKFVDPKGDTSGGLFHMLVAFTLPTDEFEALQSAVKKAKPGAKLLGPVPLRQEEEGSFVLISGTLTDKGFTRNVISSGRAPVTPGSKAAVAATLTAHGATLLWESLTRPTSDVSVALRTYYEAMLPSFSAQVHADVSTVYTHFSRVKNVQQEYTRRQLRDIFDELIRTGTVNVKILDRLPEDSANRAMQSMVDLVTNKLTEIIFDQETGFTAIPEKEKAVESGQIKGRQQKGWLAKLFTSTGNQKYYTDNQYVLKKREDINRAVFSINLTRRAVVKVPVDTAGNISGLYEAFQDDPAYFRVVNLADTAFEKRDVYFGIDGDFVGAFAKLMNFAGVSVRKEYANHPVATGELIFTREDIREGRLSKSWRYARLGEESDTWLQYGYRVTWSIQGRHQVKQPEEEGKWTQSGDPSVNLAPPLDRLDMEIDADRFLFDEAGIRSAVLEVRYSVFGQGKQERLSIMRVTDAESVASAVLFCDPGRPVEYRTKWFFMEGRATDRDWQALESTYLVLIPPQLRPEPR